MHIVLLTNEYPPNVYGGAGIHVEKLAAALARADGGAHRVDVLCFGEPRDEDAANLHVQSVEAPCEVPARRPEHARLLDTLGKNLAMAGRIGEADIVHAHTWYTHFGGVLAQQLTGARLVLTTHSLEPHRPWKAEQLGTAYRTSTWVERHAYESADGVVAVSRAMADDVRALYGVDGARIATIPNGIDPDEFAPRLDPAAVAALGVDPAEPYVLFVGRVTRQKGLGHLLRALHHLARPTQVVLAAGQPDTPEIAAETEAAVAALRAETAHRVVWLSTMLPREALAALYTHAAVFACPSVYEPFGIINLEAMGCACPVVASAVGGIPEVVVDGETGLLVPFEPVGGASGDEDPEPRDPDGFARAFGAALNAVLADPERARAMGRAGRARVETRFTWEAIARRTLALYARLVAGPGAWPRKRRP